MWQSAESAKAGETVAQVEESSMGSVRRVIRIDEARCDGCGECVLSCAEGAIRLEHGRAKLVGDAYCDGLGACIGECPLGALTLEERPAEEFDADAVRERLRLLRQPFYPAPGHPAHPGGPVFHARQGGQPAAERAWPGSAVRDLRSEVPERAVDEREVERPSRLAQWPVQLGLLPPRAPFLDGAELLIAADCAAYACADFHERFLRGRALAIACPKLDDPAPYREKLGRLFRENELRSVHVVHMEVPCCHALLRLVRDGLASSGRTVPLAVTELPLRGGKEARG
jgi:ferredoxin